MTMISMGNNPILGSRRVYISICLLSSRNFVRKCFYAFSTSLQAERERERVCVCVLNDWNFGYQLVYGDCKTMHDYGEIT